MVTICPMVEDDLPFLLQVRNASRDMLHDNREFSLDECTKWWRSTKPRFFTIKHNDISVGYIRTSNWDENNLSVYIGADIAPEHRRRGYARQAYKLMLDTLFKSGMRKVSLEVLSHNRPAIKLYESLGFVRQGVKRQEIVRDNKTIDSILMSITLSE